MSFLEADGVVRRFGGVTALNGVDIRLREGEIRALIGPNGSGKTTFFNVLTGIYPPQVGTIRFLGRPLTGLPPHRVAMAGIRRTFQEIQLFYDMTVLENVMLAVRRPERTGAHREWFGPRTRDVQRKAMAVLELVGLGESRDELARNLAYGGQRLLEIARALAGDPRLLLLDEPSAGMGGPDVAALMALIRQLNDRGLTILLVEHNMRLAMGISDVVTVLNYGRKIAEGAPAAVKANSQVVAAYLGEEIEAV